MRDYSKTSENYQDFSQELHSLTKNSFDFIQKNIIRFTKSKDKTQNLLSFISNKDLTFKQNHHLADNVLKNVNECGSWLEFRHYYKQDKTKLHNANFCKKDKLCPACAMRRASKQVKKVFDYLQVNQELRTKNWYYIVLPVKHNSKEDFETVFNRARGGLDTIRQAIRDNKRGKGKKSFFSQFDGLFYSFEVTKTKNGWNNHINLLCCSDVDIKGIYKKGKTFIHNDIMRDWAKYTDNNSFVHSINKIDTSTDEVMIKNLLEVFKYSLKFQSLKNEDLLEVYKYTYRKRLLGAFGCFYGIKVEDVELSGDDVLDDKFLEIIFRYDFKNKKYFEYSRKNVELPPAPKKQREKVYLKEHKKKKPLKTPVFIYDKYNNLVNKYDIINLKNFSDFDIFRIMPQNILSKIKQVT